MDDEETRRLGFRVRKNVTHEEVLDLYVGAPSLFSIKLHHNGRFTHFPERTYVEGGENFIDLLDHDKFSDIERYCHYQVPGSDLDFGLRALGSDDDVIGFIKYGVTTVHTYFFSPTKVRVEEITDEELMAFDLDKVEDVVNHVDNMHTEQVVENMNFHDAFDFTNIDLNDPNFDPFFGESPAINVPKHDQPQDNMHKHHNENVDEVMNISKYGSDDDNASEDNDDQVLDVCLKELQEDAIDNDQFVSGSESDEDESSHRKRTMNKEEVQQMIKRHADDTSWQLRIIKDDLGRVRAVCCGDIPHLDESGNLKSVDGYTDFVMERKPWVGTGHTIKTCKNPEVVVGSSSKSKDKGQNVKDKGEVGSDNLWKLAKATIVQEFEKEIDALKAFNSECHLWLSNILAKHWSRSHFSGRVVFDMLLN
ncbi:hypothetical protein M8C21_018386, partial [Ambrosia artemisiifolia]